MDGKLCVAEDVFVWKFFLRQVLVCSGSWTIYFMLGLWAGAPTVLIPQLRREANSTDAITDEMASWLYATLIYSGLPWIFIVPYMFWKTGRKITHIIVCSFNFVGFILFYCSTSYTHIIISEVFHGGIAASFLSLSLIAIVEFTSTKYRGIFLTLKCATFFWGMLLSNTIGTFFYWKNIGLVGIVCSLYTLVSVIYWPESPYWLASRKSFEDCKTVHRWLKGCDVKSEMELEKLIQLNCNNTQDNNTVSKDTILNILKSICSKQFYKPMLICLVVLLLSIFSGKFVIALYAIDVFKRITNDESTAYKNMLILDGVTVMSMYVGCFLSKKLKRRPMLLSFATSGIVFLFLMSLYLFLIRFEVVVRNNYILLSLLTGYSLSISIGPLILSTSVIGELIPIDLRSVSTCLIQLSFKLMNGTLLKLAPYIFKMLDMAGTFLFFGILSSICLLVLYKYLPETKDKSLHEIADSIVGRKLVIEEAKELIPIKSDDVNDIKIMKPE